MQAAQQRTAKPVGFPQKTDLTSRNRSTGMRKLPLELRNEIYNHIIGGCSALVIPKDFEGSVLSFLSRRLPHCLILNHQTYEEAAKAYLFRTLWLMETVSVPGPDFLLLEIPSSITFKGIRYLEFTQPQGQSAIDKSAEPAPPSKSPLDVKEVLSRSPELRELTMSVTAGILFAADKEPGELRLRTMEDMDELFKFTQILEHNGLQKVQLICNDANPHARLVDQFYQDIFVPFTKWFMQQAHNRGRNISFNLRICPSWNYDPYDPELTWDDRGYITSYYWRDFFG